MLHRANRARSIAALLAATAVVSHAAAAASTIEGKLVHVRDADTIEVATSRGIIAVRLNGVDAPELSERGGKAGREWVRRSFAGQLITCWLNGDRTHDSWVGICYSREGHDIGASVISAGHARDCPRYSGGRYRQFETEASRAIPSKSYCR